MCRVPLLVTFDLELSPQGQISDFTITNCHLVGQLQILLYSIHFLVDFFPVSPSFALLDLVLYL
jgi:hypothetical protein